MAAMRKPFVNYSRNDIYAKVIEGRRRPHVYENWPEEFKSLIQRCWAHDANRRPNFSRVLEDIAKITENLSHQAIPQPPFQHVSWFTGYAPPAVENVVLDSFAKSGRVRERSPFALDA